MNFHKSMTEEGISDRWYRKFVGNKNTTKSNDNEMNKKSLVKTTSNSIMSNIRDSSKTGFQMSQTAQLNFNCHANTTYNPYAHHNIPPSGMAVGDQKDRTLQTEKNNILHHRDLLKQIDDDKTKRSEEKEREQNLDSNANRGSSLLCGDALLTDIYGHVLVRRNKEAPKSLKRETMHEGEVNDEMSRAQEAMQLSSELFIASLRKNLDDSKKEEMVNNERGSYGGDSSKGEQGSSFARGGHGIFGVPYTDSEKLKRMKYQQELLGQINDKREKERKEKELQKIEDEKIQRELERDQEEEDRRREMEGKRGRVGEQDGQNQNSRGSMHEYKQELLKQIEVKRERNVEATRLSILEDQQLLGRNEGRPLERGGDIPTQIRRKKMKFDLTRKPRHSSEEYQQELLQQMREKRVKEALEKELECTKEEDIFRINEGKIAQLILENQLIQPKLKHFEVKNHENKDREVNKRYQEFLIQQMRNREAQLAEAKERELLKELRDMQEEERKQRERMEGSTTRNEYKHALSLLERGCFKGLPEREKIDEDTLEDIDNLSIDEDGAVLERGGLLEGKNSEESSFGGEYGNESVENDEDLYNIFHKAKQVRKIMYSEDLLRQIEAKKNDMENERKFEKIEEERMVRLNRERERRRLMGERRSKRKEDKITNDQLCLQNDSVDEPSGPVAPLRTSVNKKGSMTCNSNSKGDNPLLGHDDSSNSNPSKVMSCENAPGFWGILNRCRVHRLKAKKAFKDGVGKNHKTTCDNSSLTT